jgi:benzodiazapine receptor
MAKLNTNYEWYKELKKPTWAPPSWLFGVVWSVLYFVITISYLYVIRRIFVASIPRWVLLPFGLNVLFNLIYTPIQFRLKNNYLALADVLLVVVTLVWALVAVFPYSHIVTYANVPYLLWGAFASVLQAKIVVLNRKRIARSAHS